MSMKRQQRERIGRLFDSLVRGQFDEFMSGCPTIWPSRCGDRAPAPMVLRRSDIPDWYGSLQALSPTSLSSSVEVVRVDGERATVMLRHEFARNGIDYRLEMVNLVSFRDGLVAEWSSYPLDLPEYCPGVADARPLDAHPGVVDNVGGASHGSSPTISTSPSRWTAPVGIRRPGASPTPVPPSSSRPATGSTWSKRPSGACSTS